jgi:uncharacterized protein YnzC (UPF0291/DUF896 family)
MPFVSFRWELQGRKKPKKLTAADKAEQAELAKLW